MWQALSCACSRADFSDWQEKETRQLMSKNDTLKRPIIFAFKMKTEFSLNRGFGLEQIVVKIRGPKVKKMRHKR